MNKLKITLISILFISICFACKKDETTTPTTPTPVPSGCDVSSISFSTTIFPIIQNNCLPCHSASQRSGGVQIDTYETIKNSFVDGRSLGTIKHSSGFSQMPRNGSKLSDCSIAQIEAWINDGTPNN